MLRGSILTLLRLSVLILTLWRSWLRVGLGWRLRSALSILLVLLSRLLCCRTWFLRRFRGRGRSLLPVLALLGLLTGLRSLRSPLSALLVLCSRFTMLLWLLM